MTGDDDRQRFEEERRRHAAALGADEEVTRRATDLSAAADRYDYSYMWNWCGLPIIQMPTDIVVMQEVIWSTKPQAIIETGIARGGSLILYASIMELLGDGVAIGIDIDIRRHNEEAVLNHPLAHRVRMIEGSSTDLHIAARARRMVEGLERVMVVLDSNHTHSHVLEELFLYSPLVTVGHFLVVADTFLEEIPAQTHRPRPWGPGNNPKTAVTEFLDRCDRFIVESSIDNKLLMSSSRGGYLRRIK